MLLPVERPKYYRSVLVAVVLVSLMAGLLLVTGGSAKAALASSPRATKSARQIHIVGVLAQITDPYFISVECGAKAAAKALGNTQVTFQGPTSPSVAQEITTLDSVAVAKPSAVILGPFDPHAFISPVVSLMNEGIPVYLVDSFLARDVALGATNTDVVLSANTLANSIAGLMGYKGQLAIIAFGPGDPYEGPRYLNMVKVLRAKYPKIEVLPVQYAASDENKGAEVAAGLLARYPHLGAIYATDGPAGEGAVAALTDAHKIGVIKVIAFDAEPLQVRDLRQGSTQALYAQAPYIEGYTAVTHLVQYLRSAVGSKGGKVSPSVPYYVPSPQNFITKANLSSPATQPYLYRSSC
jgi:ribose transport system substrate-binding protein